MSSMIFRTSANTTVSKWIGFLVISLGSHGFPQGYSHEGLLFFSNRYKSTVIFHFYKERINNTALFMRGAWVCTCLDYV